MQSGCFDPMSQLHDEQGPSCMTVGYVETLQLEDESLQLEVSITVPDSKIPERDPDESLLPEDSITVPDLRIPQRDPTLEFCR